VKHKLDDQVVELKDDGSLFARMLIVARSRPKINLQECIGQHEFTFLSRALFTVSGKLLPCTDKSWLMAILKELPNKTGDDVQPEDTTNEGTLLPPKKVVTVIDGMAVVQGMGKPSWIKTCAQWADHFTAILDSTSLKESTRERRQNGKPLITYHVADKKPVGKVSAKQFLSSTTTKDELTVYLAKKVFHHFHGKSTVFIVTARQDVLSNNIDVQHLYSSQEEADTRIILHSLDAAQRGATELYIQSPDTDVFVLAIHRYHQLCKDTYLITGVGNKKRLVPLRPVAHALGAAKAKALPGFHAFSGADTTGRFAGKGKLSCWQALSRCPAVVVSAFVILGTSEELKPDTESAIEAFVCQLYEPGTTAVDVDELRWKLFTKKQLEAQKLPPTQGALQEAIARAHYQARVWYQDDIYLTHRYHQQQSVGGRKREID